MIFQLLCTLQRSHPQSTPTLLTPLAMLTFFHLPFPLVIVTLFSLFMCLVLFGLVIYYAFMYVSVLVFTYLFLYSAYELFSKILLVATSLSFSSPENIYLFIYLFFIYFLLLFPQHSYFFPLYSLGTQLPIHAYLIFSPIVVLHCKYLDIVLSAAQQDLIVNPFQAQ